MSEQPPASEAMRRLFHETVELSHLKPNVQQRTASQTMAWLDRHSELHARQNALYARMQVEEAEREQMRGLLVLFAADDAEPIISDANGYTCVLCDTLVDDYEIDHFPHAPDCPWVQARALLAKRQG